jgi:adenylate cyclase
MQAASAVLLAPWQTGAGLAVLYTAFLAHGLLGFYALYRRRHLRMPANEAWQLALGLTIPFLLMSHAVGIRLGEFQYGRELGYLPVLNKFWVVSPDFALPRQLLLLLVLWLHGCIGLRAWLRTKRAYYRVTGLLASLATLVPVLAILGVVNAGLNLREAELRDPAYAASLGPAPGSREAQYATSAVRIADGMAISYLGLVITAFGLRAARNWHAKRFRAVRITYPRTSCRCRPIRLLRTGGKPLDRDSARVSVRRPRPLLDLQSPHRRECATSRGSQSGGARHANAN